MTWLGGQIVVIRTVHSKISYIAPLLPVTHSVPSEKRRGYVVLRALVSELRLSAWFQCIAGHKHYTLSRKSEKEAAQGPLPRA